MLHYFKNADMISKCFSKTKLKKLFNYTTELNMYNIFQFKLGLNAKCRTLY